MARNPTERDSLHNNTPSDGLTSAKPVFFTQAKELAITTQDVYRAVGGVIECENIRGLQRVGNLWRIYPGYEENRVDLLTHGISIKGARITLTDVNPFTPRYDGTKLTIHGIPLSASDTVILEALRTHGVYVISPVERQLLRIDGKLTNCQTGGRTVYIKFEGASEIPRSMEMGRYRASVYYRGQQPSSRGYNTGITCKKCLLPGHRAHACLNDWVCHACRRPGHKRGSPECPAVPEERGETDEPPSGQEQEDQKEEPVAEHTDESGPDETVEQPGPITGQAVSAVPKQRRKSQRMVKKKAAPGVQNPRQGADNTSSKITKFLASMKDRGTVENSASDTEATTGKKNPLQQRQVRSPRTPPETQNDQSKRPKDTGHTSDGGKFPDY